MLASWASCGIVLCLLVADARPVLFDLLQVRYRLISIAIFMWYFYYVFYIRFSANTGGQYFLYLYSKHGCVIFVACDVIFQPMFVMCLIEIWLMWYFLCCCDMFLFLTEFVNLEDVMQTQKCAFCISSEFYIFSKNLCQHFDVIFPFYLVIF